MNGVIRSFEKGGKVIIIMSIVCLLRATKNKL